jgi:hypothetical protein
MRTLREPDYRERVSYYRHLGRREGQRIMLRRIVALLILAGLMFGALALIHSRPAQAASKPTPTGGGRVMVAPSPLVKWVRLYILNHTAIDPTRARFMANHAHVECRGVKCAAYGPGLPALVLVKLASGRFRIVWASLPAVGPALAS